MNQKEIWKDVIGYEGYYQVSNFGNVLSLRKNRNLKPKEKRGGYLCIVLSVNNIQKHVSIHRLLAIAFLGDSELQVNHKDGNKKNNHIDNIEFMTSRDNINHYWSNTNKTSKYTGVCWHKHRSKWTAQKQINGKHTYLGLFDNEIDAYNKYINA